MVGEGGGEKEDEGDTSFGHNLASAPAPICCLPRALSAEELDVQSQYLGSCCHKQNIVACVEPGRCHRLRGLQV